MSQILVVVLMMIAGAGLAVQAATNARMGVALNATVMAALMNFVVGSVLLALVAIPSAVGRWTPSGLLSAPWWAYIGGALGATFVATSIWAVPRLGTAALFAAIIFGQLLMAMLIDTHGWLNVPQIPLNPWRLIGVGLLLAGVVMMQQK
ncbi:MAG: DMT family transporter [Rhodospirillales bacterium]|nr:DMT family transporter [Rhodospirillales bacterium]